jgi:uncharacterized protein (TIGR02001 family)
MEKTMPRHLFAYAALLSLATAAAAPVHAQAQAGPSYAFNLGAASDYVFRGVDQTAGRGQVFAGADASLKDVYAGVFTSNVHFSNLGDPRVDQELDAYGGWRPEVLGYQLDVGLIYYGYLHQARSAHDDFAEASLRVGRSIGPLSGAVSVHYSPEFQGRTGQAWYSEATAAYAITPSVTASAALARQAIARAPDYTTWNLGGTWSFAPRLTLDLRYWDTDRHGLGQPYRAKLVAGVKASF